MQAYSALSCEAGPRRASRVALEGVAGAGWEAWRGRALEARRLGMRFGMRVVRCMSCSPLTTPYSGNGFALGQFFPLAPVKRPADIGRQRDASPPAESPY